MKHLHWITTGLLSILMETRSLSRIKWTWCHLLSFNAMSPAWISFTPKTRKKVIDDFIILSWSTKSSPSFFPGRVKQEELVYSRENGCRVSKLYHSHALVVSACDALVTKRHPFSCAFTCSSRSTITEKKEGLVVYIVDKWLQSIIRKFKCCTYNKVRRLYQTTCS